MNLTVFEGKNKEELKEKLLKELKCEESECLFKYETKKGGLFKSESYVIKGITLNNVKNDIATFLKDLVTNMDLEVNIESNIRDNQINIKMFSNNNAILIGKNGQTLIALQNLIKQFVFNKIEMYPYVILDVENYKDKQKKHLEILARKLAREVKKTGNSISMDSMNSYERRIVHNALTDISGVTSKSEGEEPNRHIVISKC